MAALTARVSPRWSAEVRRDVLALGSVVFYLLVVGRSLVGPFWDLTVPLLAIGVTLLAAYPLLHTTDLYVTRAAVVAVLVTEHYEDPVFGAFAAVAFVALTVFAVQLGHPRANVLRGLALGGALGAAGWFLSGWVQ